MMRKKLSLRASDIGHWLAMTACFRGLPRRLRLLATTAWFGVAIPPVLPAYRKTFPGVEAKQPMTV